MPSSTTSFAGVLDLLREIVNRITDRSNEDRSLEYRPLRLTIFPSFVLRNSPLSDSIRRFPSVGRIIREDLVGIGKELVTLSLSLFAVRFALFPSLDAGNFFTTILYQGSAFSFRFSSWNMYNVYNRSSVSKVGNLPGRSTIVLAGLTFLFWCFFPFRLLPRLRDFI